MQYHVLLASGRHAVYSGELSVRGSCAGIARQDACNTLGRGAEYRTACRSLDPQEQQRVGSFRLLPLAGSALPHGHAVQQRPPAAVRRGVVAVRVMHGRGGAPTSRLELRGGTARPAGDGTARSSCCFRAAHSELLVLGGCGPQPPPVSAVAEFALSGTGDYRRQLLVSRCGPAGQGADGAAAGAAAGGAR
jgi:hypothetical protein